MPEHYCLGLRRQWNPVAAGTVSPVRYGRWPLLRCRPHMMLRSSRPGAAGYRRCTDFTELDRKRYLMELLE